jgi:hypothetical protein
MRHLKYCFYTAANFVSGVRLKGGVQHTPKLTEGVSFAE